MERVEDREALAVRVENLGCDLTCPLCGESGFDAPGISNHWFQWCEVERVNHCMKDNAAVAAAIRAPLGQQVAAYIKEQGDADR